MITREFAEAFSREWIAAWNAHDIERVLSHYADDFELASPFIVQIAGVPEGRLVGKAAVRAYWAEALRRMPDLLFRLRGCRIGRGRMPESGANAVRAARTSMAAETAGRRRRRPARYSTATPSSRSSRSAAAKAKGFRSRGPPAA